MPIEDTSNFKYMVTKVPFEAGGYLIFRPEVDRCVDSTQCDYGGLKKGMFVKRCDASSRR